MIDVSSRLASARIVNLSAAINAKEQNMAKKRIKQRLEYLLAIRFAGCMSYGELSELQDLAPHIEDGDVELLEAAGVPEEEAKEQGRC
jgi:hypothetical protein